jgi:hypothetical protein
MMGYPRSSNRRSYLTELGGVQQLLHADKVFDLADALRCCFAAWRITAACRICGPRARKTVLTEN